MALAITAFAAVTVAASSLAGTLRATNRNGTVSGASSSSCPG